MRGGKTMERVNHIYLRKGGLILDTYQDIYGNLYYQEIRYGCKSRDRKVKEDIQYQTFYDFLFYEDFKTITEKEFMEATK